MNKYKKYMIICICVLAFSVVGSTVAYYVGVYFRISASTITYGLDYYINYNKGQNISSATLEGTTDYLGGNSSDIELWKKDDTYNIYGHLYLDIVDIGSNLSNSEALRYTVVNNNVIISEGTLAGNTTGSSVLIASDIPLQTNKQLYTVYIWLDVVNLTDGSISNESLSLMVRCEASMKPFNSSVKLISHLRNLYTLRGPELITQDESNDSYYYSYQDNGKTWGLMNDGLKVADTPGTGATTITDTTKLTTGTEGNIRYFGPSSKVNNYIYFNCNDYSNSSLTDSNGNKNCELWRIIGIVDGKVKIVKNASIGNLAWDQDKNQDSSLTTYSNNWETSSLQLFLNGLYYNRGTTETHTYYSLTGTTSTELNLVDIGITEATRTNNLISESIWYLGGYNSPKIYPSEIYAYERTNSSENPQTIYGDNPFTIVANVGLMYPSDYGYGTNFKTCGMTLYNYGSGENSQACMTNDWIHGPIQWFITHSLLNYSTVFLSSSSGELRIRDDANGNYAVRPSLYLNPEVYIDLDTTGTSTDPYRIIVS